MFSGLGICFLHHCIQCVIDNVQKDLLDLVRIAENRRYFSIDFTLQLDTVDLHVIVAEQQGFFEHFHYIKFVLLRLALPGE